MITIQHLRKEYESATPLKDVNTTINQGDIIAIIGPSGTGKSTLLRCINLLEKPTSGHILIDGEDITDPKCDINKLRSKLGMVFQSFNLYEHLTVVENCMIAQTLILKKNRQEAYDKAIKLLASVGMDNKALQYPSQLSGGQKQRVAIARTLCMEPEIIMFDEPTSALDPLTVGEVEDVIKNLSKQGTTMMIVTHSMEFARKIANRVFYMDQGEIYEDGTPEQIFDNPQKELTRKFVLNLSMFEMTITEENHDLGSEMNNIYNFCKENGVETNRAMKACGAFEEYYAILYRYAFKDDKTLRVRLQYIKNKDKLVISFAPNSTKDWSDISQTIISSHEYKLFINDVSGYSETTAETGDSTTFYNYEIRKEAR